MKKVVRSAKRRLLITIPTRRRHETLIVAETGEQCETLN